MQPGQPSCQALTACRGGTVENGMQGSPGSTSAGRFGTPRHARLVTGTLLTTVSCLLAIDSPQCFKLTWP